MNNKIWIIIFINEKKKKEYKSQIKSLVTYIIYVYNLKEYINNNNNFITVILFNRRQHELKGIFIITIFPFLTTPTANLTNLIVFHIIKILKYIYIFILLFFFLTLLYPVLEICTFHLLLVPNTTMCHNYVQLGDLFYLNQFNFFIYIYIYDLLAMKSFSN